MVTFSLALFITGLRILRFEVEQASRGLSAIAELLVMVALCNRADHYIFILWFLLSFFFFLA